MLPLLVIEHKWLPPLLCEKDGYLDISADMTVDEAPSWKRCMGIWPKSIAKWRS
jgi:hypothetical protein